MDCFVRECHQRLPVRFPTSLGESRQHFRPCAQREKARLFSLLFRIRVHHNIVLYPGRSNYLKGKDGLDWWSCE